VPVNAPTSTRTHGHRVAVIGAGVAGLACASTLAAQGRAVTVFDRGLRLGGRLSARRVSLGDETIACADHGAPFFTCTQALFRRHVQRWIEDGICAVWNPDRQVLSNGQLNRELAPEPLLVGVPDMRSITNHLATRVDVRAGTTVTSIDRTPDGWSLCIEARDGAAVASGLFELVVMAAMPQQTARVFGEHSAKILQEIGNSTAQPCWAHTVLLMGRIPELPSVLRVLGDNVIELIVRDDAKPGRHLHNDVSILVAYARADWSASEYDAPPAAVGRAMADRLLGLLRSLTSRDLEVSKFSPAAAHRWGLARSSSFTSCECAVDEALGLVACGDGFGGSGLEAAFLSGLAAAAAVFSFEREL